MRFALIFETGRDSMPEGWINERFRNYQKRLLDDNRKKRWESDALNSYPSMFQNLQDYVETDVEAHNKMFPVPLDFKTVADGFYVATPNFKAKDGRSVDVTRAVSGTVIQIEFHDGPGKTRHDRIDVVPDEHGNIRYRHNGKTLPDVSDASEVILDSFIEK
jgi:hypothetical protein